LLKTWTESDLAYVRRYFGVLKTEDIADYLGKSVNAVNLIVQRKLGGRKVLRAQNDEARNVAAASGIKCAEPVSPNLRGQGVVMWTREKVLEGLQAVAKEFKMVPTSDEIYNPVKKGRFDWPPAIYIYKYFPTFPEAWLAAGVGPKRINLSSAKWTTREDAYLLDHAGNIRLVDIARHLRRSYPAVRGRLRFKNHLKARHNQGLLSAAVLSKHYDCPYHRVRDALIAGKIKGYRSPIRREWQVDLADIDEVALEILSGPKLKSYRNRPPDRGDYYERYGIRRTTVDGKTIRVEAVAKSGV